MNILLEAEMTVQLVASSIRVFKNGLKSEVRFIDLYKATPNLSKAGQSAGNTD